MRFPFTEHRLRYFTGEKSVGETPLVALERLRKERELPESLPLAYAGRLDPMASGKLLILVGEECKVQERYHSFDKEYEVKVLLGIQSDSGDVLGLVHPCGGGAVDRERVLPTLRKLEGIIRLPYPHFSSKTVKGKPLHTWALEGRLDEIDIPVKESTIYKLAFGSIALISKEELLKTVRAKIESIPTVTEPSKALGADFRREAVRETWNRIAEHPKSEYQVLSFTCTASSGSYMRSLGERIAKELGTCGLAYAIHRTKIGRYRKLTRNLGLWTKTF